MPQLNFHPGSRILLRESCLFCADTARLAFPIDDILAVRSFCEDEVFIPGRDYRLTSDGLLERLPHGRIPCTTEAALHPAGDEAILYPAPNANAIGGGIDGRNIRFTRTDWYSQHQVWIDYRAQNLDFPVIAGPDNHFREAVAQRLRRPDGLSISFIGDSITYGCNSSLDIGIPPYQPAYPGLVAEELARRATGALTWRNHAVGGAGCRDALTRHTEWQNDRPDVLVIAYGMNNFGNMSASDYLEELKRIMARAHELRSDTLILLVASMAGNAAWRNTPPEKAAAYADILREFAAQTPHTGLADVYHVWEEMCRRKGYVSLTGNGVNHPNDYGYRLYAAALLNELVGERFI